MRVLIDAVTTQLAQAVALDATIREDAVREARLLIAAVLGWTTGELARRVGETPSADVAERVRDAASRRARGEPLAYAVGTAAFRHLTLAVDARVLIPRPETEELVDHVLRLTAEATGGIAVDIGTGSGAIALALATEGQFDQVIATDISDDALQVATANRDRIAPRTPVEFRRGSDLAPLRGVRARVIASNPPYIAYDEAERLPSAVRDWEPATALFAADGGMARYEVLLAAGQHYLEDGGWIALEVDASRAVDTATRATHHGWSRVQIVKDLSGRDRILLAQASLHAHTGSA
ncbi:MAG: peptide chain release factor N(5)-glutamine methyltransferase [Gemmatimonadaceae bacterium]|nr:peptide chain release factor N(5)-glutamine methyltransferase [Gemmatimonadaceae bacterium]